MQCVSLKYTTAKLVVAVKKKNALANAVALLCNSKCLMAIHAVITVRINNLHATVLLINET